MFEIPEFEKACSALIASVSKPLTPITPEQVLSILDGLTQVAIRFGFRHRPQIIFPYAFMVDPDGLTSFKVGM